MPVSRPTRPVDFSAVNPLGKTLLTRVHVALHMGMSASFMRRNVPLTLLVRPPKKQNAQRSVSMWIRKEIQAVLWKNDTPLKIGSVTHVFARCKRGQQDHGNQLGV
jgi:hypothetical protein